jgi:hypothetical protein
MGGGRKSEIRNNTQILNLKLIAHNRQFDGDKNVTPLPITT